MISCKKLQKSITSNLKNRQQKPYYRGYEIMKNAEMNKTKVMSMDETVLVLVRKKIDMSGSNLTAGIPARSIIKVLDTSNNK